MLCRDWDVITQMVKNASKYKEIGTYSGNVLNLTVKGDSQYVYPSITLRASGVTEAYNACKDYMAAYQAKVLAEQAHREAPAVE